MKTIIPFLFGIAFTALAAFGVETSISLDVARKNSSISLSYTECCDHAVRATIRDNGDDFDCNGWEVNLVFGAGDSGCVHEGVVAYANEVLFNIPASSMPTNGKYTVQVMAMKSGRSYEWGRGTLRVNANPGMDYMPTCWMGYQKVARLAASMISLELLTNALVEAVITNCNPRINTAVWTNCCLRVTKSKCPEIAKAGYVWDGSNETARVFRSHLDSGGFFVLPNNYAISNSVYRIVGETEELFLPERIANYWWFRSTTDGTRKFMVKPTFVNESTWRHYLMGE